MARGERGQGNRKEVFRGGSARSNKGMVALLAAVIGGAAAFSGCAGVAGSSNSNPTPQAQVQISPESLTFPNVNVGQQVTQSATLTNSGSQPVNITALSFSASEFSASGISTPVNLGPGQSVMFQVAFRSASNGSVSGTLSAMTSRGSGSTHVKLKGGATKTPSQMTLSSSSLKFGNVLVNSNSTQAVTLSNSGQTDMQIQQINVSGSGFSVSGATLPATLPAGQSTTLQAIFAPATTGAVNGSITIITDSQTPTATVGLSGSGVSATYSMALTPSSVSFGNVNPGGSSSQKVQLSNTGNSNVTITQAVASGSGISVSGISGQLTLAPSQTVPLTVTYAPTAAGSTTGAITVTNNDGVNVTAAVTGTAVQASLGVTPSNLSFGSLVIGGSSTQTVQLTNTGSASLTVSQATAGGSGFSLKGATLPMTLAPGQSSSLTVQYAPQTTGTATGSITIASTAPNSPATVGLSGSATSATYTMTLNPASVSFGNVNTGSKATQTVQLTNTGNGNCTITQVAASGSGISVSGLTLPATLAPSQSVPLTVTFAPTATGSANGGVTVTNGQGGTAYDAVSGAGVQAGLSVTPGSASFGSVTTGSSNSQTLQLKNSGAANLTISQATASGAGFSISGLSLPMTLAPGQTANFNAQYSPQTAGSATGAVSIVSNAPNSPATVSLSGSGVTATATLSVNPQSLSFGSVNDGSTASQSFMVTNTGNSNVSISGVTVGGAGYSILSGAGAVTLSPNQSVGVSVQFAPTTAGSLTGTVSVVSNASGSPAVVSLSGTGVSQPVQHTIHLNWAASSSSVSGYNLYRSTVSGGSYAKVNVSLLGGMSYSDATVRSGATYYYVATAVDASGNESAYSNEVPAVVP